MGRLYWLTAPCITFWMAVELCSRKVRIELAVTLVVA